MPGQIFVITVRPRVFWPATRLSWPHGSARFRSDRGCCIVKQRPAGEGQVCCSVCMMADGRVLLRDVTVRYGRHIALEAVSGGFAPGSLTAVVGVNGAGKSSLLAAIAGVVRLARGAVDCPARQRLAY